MPSGRCRICVDLQRMCPANRGRGPFAQRRLQAMARMLPEMEQTFIVMRTEQASWLHAVRLSPFHAIEELRDLVRWNKQHMAPLTIQEAKLP